jgi:hypothetical protein
MDRLLALIEAEGIAAPSPIEVWLCAWPFA